jgi:hypothetical protein
MPLTLYQAHGLLMYCNCYTVIACLSTIPVSICPVDHVIRPDHARSKSDDSYLNDQGVGNEGREDVSLTSKRSFKFQIDS